jgi:hypothetical protein
MISAEDRKFMITENYAGWNRRYHNIYAKTVTTLKWLGQ